MNGRIIGLMRGSAGEVRQVDAFARAAFQGAQSIDPRTGTPQRASVRHGNAVPNG
jgi:hypothetical protein